MKNKRTKTKAKLDPMEEIEIIPLRDFPSGIHWNHIHIVNIKEGQPVAIPRMFLPNMVTEGVIKSIPKEG